MLLNKFLEKLNLKIYLVGQTSEPTEKRNFHVNYMVVVDPTERCFIRKSILIDNIRINYVLFDINRLPFGINNGVFDCQRMMRSIVYINPKYEEQLKTFIEITKLPVWIKRMFDLTSNLYHLKVEDKVREYLNVTRCYSHLRYLKDILTSIKLDEEYNIDQIKYDLTINTNKEKLDSLFLEVELLMNKFPDRYKSKLIPSREGRSGRRLRRYYYGKLSLALDNIKLMN